MKALAWILDSDPAIRWQALRDLTEASPDEVAGERARVSHEGLGQLILAAQQGDGTWRREGESAWRTTLFTLQLLRATGIDPAVDSVKTAMDRLESGVRWNDLPGAGWDLRPVETGGNTFFQGEEEPCINGGVLAIGAYFGRLRPRLLERLLSEQLEDGGWNCEAPRSRRSSFHTTLCVLEGLLECERAGEVDSAIPEARRRAEEYLLQRRLYKRHSTGEVACSNFLDFAFPPEYRYDLLRALDYFRAASHNLDPRMSDAIEVLAGKQQPNGTWLLDARYAETLPVTFPEDAGEPSRWNTLRALRVLRWWKKEGVLNR